MESSGTWHSCAGSSRSTKNQNQKQSRKGHPLKVVKVMGLAGEEPHLWIRTCLLLTLCSTPLHVLHMVRLIDKGHGTGTPRQFQEEYLLPHCLESIAPRVFSSDLQSCRQQTCTANCMSMTPRIPQLVDGEGAYIYLFAVPPCPFMLERTCEMEHV